MDLEITIGLLDPKVDVEAPTAAELPVADLECDGHFVVFVEGFVEAFFGVGFELDIVRVAGGDEGEDEEEEVEE